MLILPQLEGEPQEPPAALREALTKALAMEWKLGIGQEPEVTASYTPRFFRREKKDGKLIWQDIIPAATAGPLLPVSEDLLAMHPRAAEYWPFASQAGPGSQPQQQHPSGYKVLGSTEWLSANARVLVPLRPPAPAPQRPQAAPIRRRVQLPEALPQPAPPAIPPAPAESPKLVRPTPGQ